MPVFSFPTWLLLTVLLCTQCHRQDPGPAKPEDQLPPTTQTGAGTFGCLINGQPWTPKGYTGTPGFVPVYDGAYMGGALQIKCLRFTSIGTIQAITFGAANMQQTGTYLFPSGGVNGCIYNDTSLSRSCSTLSWDYPGVYQTGSLVITRFDLSQGIISGTFDFTLYQPGCDTVKITHGRFDCTL